MVWRLLWSAAVAGVSSLALGMFLVACGSTDLGAKGSGFGVGFEVTVNSQGKKQTEFNGSLPRGWCLEVTFVDSEGKVISTSSVDVPGYVDIPDGATGQAFELLECRDTPDGASPVGAGPAIGVRAPVVTAFEWHEVSYWSIDPDSSAFNPWTNTTAAFRIHLPPGADAIEAMLDVIAAGPGSALGIGVEVEFYSQAVPNPNGMRLLVSDNEPIVGFELSWNNVAGYASLTSSNVSQYSIGNDWSVVQTLIPKADFAVGSLAWNGGTVAVQSHTAALPVSCTMWYSTSTP